MLRCVQGKSCLARAIYPEHASKVDKSATLEASKMV